MQTKRLHSIAGLFATPDEIIHAAEKTSESYKKFDVNTPYPIHGMNEAMKLKPSFMGFFALAFGLTGTLSAILLMTFTMVIDYPLNIGGKPQFPLPAFIPVTFELTVLFAAIGTVVGLLFVFFRMPDNSNPLHDTNYMKHVTSDMYGVCIEANDPSFDENQVQNFLQSLGAKDIEKIYFDDQKPAPIFSKPFIIFLIAAFAVVSGATYFVTNKLMFIVPYNWMMDQARIDAQETSDFFKDGFGMRPQVQGTVPRGFFPEDFKANPDSVAKFLNNPLEATPQLIELGKGRFLTYCSPCHGNYAKGDSRLRGLFPNPPTLHSKKVKEWPDGRIYHVITFGQNSMPSYAKQVSREDRWAIIHYIRTLQRALAPKEEDFNGKK